MFFVATQNFQGVERLLDYHPEKASLRIDRLGHEDARFLLRYQVSELNRFYFNNWERVQLVLGVMLTLVALRRPWRKKIVYIPVTMLLIVTAAHWLLTPEITHLGRLMDFVPNAKQTAEGKIFWRYHQIYSALEVLKFLLGIYLAFTVLKVSRTDQRVSLGKAGREVNGVHNP